VPRFKTLIRAAAPGLGPYDVLTPAATKKVAAQCGPADIADIIAELEGLSAAKAELPEWDGDSGDMIARAQELLAGILAVLPDQLVPDVEHGLNGADALTKQYVGLALDARRQNAARGGWLGKVIRGLLRKICLLR
jgi:hypothetical protein